MAEGSRVCPYCQRLNGIAEQECYSCGRRFPGAVGGTGLRVWTRLFAGELGLTRLFVGLCFVVFALAALSGRGLPPIWISQTFADSQLVRWGVLGGGLGTKEPWRYLSAVFLHLNLLHLGMNMWSLVALGRMLEERLGGGRFALVFVVTGVSGFVASDAWFSFSGPPTAGASGSLFGLMGALIAGLYARRDPRWKDLLVRIAVYAAIFALAIPVNNAAHAGGFIAGLPLGFLFEKERRPDRRNRTFGAIAVLLAALSVASVLLCAASPEWQRYRRFELEQGMRVPELKSFAQKSGRRFI